MLQRSARGHLGFTLIELLVVIAIIALLVSILLPSLRTAKELAVGVQCLSNTRNLALGLNMYASDQGGYLPLPKTQFTTNLTWEGSTINAPFHVYWWSAMWVGPYIGNESLSSNKFDTRGATTDIIYCPSIMSDLDYEDRVNLNSNGIGLNHIWPNNIHGDKGGPTPMDDYRNASGVALLADAANGDGTSAELWKYFVTPYNPDTQQTLEYNGTPRGVGDNGLNVYRHRKQCSTGFADGHANHYSNLVDAYEGGQLTFQAR
jgi:prepilin-type N-terminal cleavage/methylation domain-containing protein